MKENHQKKKKVTNWFLFKYLMTRSKIHLIYGKGAHKGFCHILATESALKFIRDAFCIALIVPFILKILKVSFWFFGQDKTQLH